eukprot:TRINITY_DN10814_c1_g2_i1.p1 TRINITY_DN10814_c1_g2~~TRINITY_DN10814_c1_g2_i1.p1  ORF type:complete len:166 (-),score=6.79 TRINITY_DN10814_c1_g2_i1:259-756(-)
MPDTSSTDTCSIRASTPDSIETVTLSSDESDASSENDLAPKWSKKMKEIHWLNSKKDSVSNLLAIRHARDVQKVIYQSETTSQGNVLAAAQYQKGLDRCTGVQITRFPYAKIRVLLTIIEILLSLHFQRPEGVPLPGTILSRQKKKRGTPHYLPRNIKGKTTTGC